MVIDDLYFSLEFSGHCSLEDDAPYGYVYSIKGSIVASDENENKTEAGRFHLYYVDVCAALEAEDSIFDVFDCRSSTSAYYEAIFDMDTLEPSHRLQKLFNSDPGWGNVLILNRLEVLPAFRQRNLGLRAMRKLIERFGTGAFVVAMKPFPLQCEDARHDDANWEAKLQLDSLNMNLQRSTKKLRDHYAKLGFKAMRDTPFMFRITEEPFPQLELKNDAHRSHG